MFNLTSGEEIKVNTPKDVDKYRGEFILFYPEDDDPIILFHTPLAEEARQKADEIKKESGREPVVIRVQDKETNIIEQLALIERIK